MQIDDDSSPKSEVPELMPLATETEVVTPVASAMPDSAPSPAPTPVTAIDSSPHQLAYSTLLSLMIVLLVIVAVRVTVPPLVESLRYSWHHGQLRAEYEISGKQLQNVSMNSLTDASQLVSRRVGPSVVHINLLEVHNNTDRRWLFGGGSESVEMMGRAVVSSSIKLATF